MNANELADWIEDENVVDIMFTRQEHYRGLVATMLRQQADRIAELERQSEPVAWVDEVWIKRPDLARNIGIENMFMRYAEGVKNYIPLYTTPQIKKLSDEEIEEVINKTAWVGTEEEIRVKIAKAILKKASEK